MSREMEYTVLQLAKKGGMQRAKVVHTIPQGRMTYYLIEGQDARRTWFEVVT